MTNKDVNIKYLLLPKLQTSDINITSCCMYSTQDKLEISHFSKTKKTREVLVGIIYTLP